VPRFSTLVTAAVLSTSVALIPAALQASDTAPYFTAELVQATDDAEAIAGGVLFQCVGTVCTAPRSRDRALRVCRELQREVGPIASFSSGGMPMSETQLARCNG